MPVVTVLQGPRDTDLKRELVKGITDAFVNAYGLAPETVQVWIQETAATNWGTGTSSWPTDSREDARTRRPAATVWRVGGTGQTNEDGAITCMRLSGRRRDCGGDTGGRGCRERLGRVRSRRQTPHRAGSVVRVRRPVASPPASVSSARSSTQSCSSPCCGPTRPRRLRTCAHDPHQDA